MCVVFLFLLRFFLGGASTTAVSGRCGVLSWTLDVHKKMGLRVGPALPLGGLRPTTK